METTNKFITVDFDKHKQITTSTSNVVTPLGYTISLQTDISGFSLQMRLRHVKSPQIDSLLLDLRMDNSDSWLFLRNGSLSLVLDGENEKLECNESYSDTDSFFESGVREVVYYELNKDLLDKICSATEIDMRITGDKTYIDIDNNNNSITLFQIMCQQFYNSFYDSSKYIEATTKEIKPASGCFIATAAMGNYDHPVVMDLRLFRDNWLLKRNWGISFTKWYYTHGPKVASIIEKSTYMKKITFYVIVKPLQLLTKKLR